MNANETLGLNPVPALHNSLPTHPSTHAHTRTHSRTYTRTYTLTYTRTHTHSHSSVARPFGHATSRCWPPWGKLPWKLISCRWGGVKKFALSCAWDSIPFQSGFITCICVTTASCLARGQRQETARARAWLPLGESSGRHHRYLTLYPRGV